MVHSLHSEKLWLIMSSKYWAASTILTTILNINVKIRTVAMKNTPHSSAEAAYVVILVASIGITRPVIIKRIKISIT